MKSRKCLACGVSILALAAMASFAARAHAIHHPWQHSVTPPDLNRPGIQRGRDQTPYVAPAKSRSGKWTDVRNIPFSGEGGWGPLVLTDGTVMMKQVYTGTAGVWYRLAPDSKGNYTDGTWTRLASMPSGYSPDFFAEQVLADGRVLIEGGEDNEQKAAWTNKGALYDPVANSWTTIAPPTGWSSIGDAESIILPDGTFMLADCCSQSPGEYALASISGTSVTWTTGQAWTCSSGYPCMDEEGFTALPGGDVLLVDVWDHTSTSDETWIYNPSSNSWSEGPNTADYLSSTNTFEMGPAPLTPRFGRQGTVVQFTANQSLGVNDIYDVASGTWSSGPVMRVGGTIYDFEDAPAATMPGGNILAEGSPGADATPAHFWEVRFGTTGKVTATQVNDTKTSSKSSNDGGNLIPLPTGQILWDDSFFGTEVAVYTPNGKPKMAWLPVVSSVSSTLFVGSTGNAISGTNFNGFDLGGTFGDDAQSATNFPLVRIKNSSTGDVCFGRSYGFSTMGVWTSGTTNAAFDVPPGCETGASTLQVIVNGIASKGVAVTLS